MNFSYTFDNNRPIYLQLAEQLELYITSGKIAPGARLPSVRDLAAQAKANPNTAQKALVELENRQLIYTERTNGKFVTTNTKLLLKHRDRFIHEKIQNFLNDMQNLGFSQTDVITYLTKEGGKK